MRRPATLLILLLTTALLALPGCGSSDSDDSGPDPKDEPTDAAAKPPAGYTTVENKVSGFTISVPDSWNETTKKGLTQVKSDDKLVVVTAAADRSEKGRDTTAAKYASGTLSALPNFKTDGKVKTIKGSKYENAYVTGTGKVAGEKAPQTVRAVIYRRPGKVTYGVLVFSNAAVKPHFNDKKIDQILSSFRAQAPTSTSG